MKKDSRTAFTLLELLIVVAIIGILLALLSPVLSKMRTKARIMAAKNDVEQLSVAWNQYLLDYYKFPDITITEIGSNSLCILRGDDFGAGSLYNPRKFPYMDFRNDTTNFCDPWSTGGVDGIYHVVLDDDYDNKVTYSGPNGDVEYPLHVIVWSDGPDGINGTEDDVGSWVEGR